MSRKKFFLVILFSLAFGLLAAATVYAQEPQPTPSDDQVNAIARQLYCPVCENTPLDVCPTTACAQWRDLIRQKLEAGWGEQQIKDYFVTQYGARVLGSPPAKGINWLAYVVPPVIILAGIYVLFRAFSSWRRAAPSLDSQAIPSGSPAVQDTVKDEYIKRMEDEIQKD